LCGFDADVFRLFVPDLPFGKPRDEIALRRKGWRAALADFARRAAIERDDPHVLLNAIGEMRGVRSDVFGVVGGASAYIEDGFCVGRPGEIAYLLAVVGCVRCELARGI